MTLVVCFSKTLPNYLALIFILRSLLLLNEYFRS